MENQDINIIHRFLNKEIDLDNLKKQLSEEEFEYWKSTLGLINNLPRAPFDKNKAFDLLLEKRNLKQKKPWKFKIAIAASVLFFCSLFYFNYQFSNTELVTVAYQNSLKENTVILPDSSKVWLNRGAKISYSKNEWNTNRKIELEGEAYFQVKKGKKFSVTSRLGLVSVLGTTFSVSTHDEIFSVVCYSGKVAVKHANNQIILDAKKSFSSETNQISEIKNNFPLFIGKWIMFEKTPLAEVIKSIEKNKKVIIEFNINQSFVFSGGYSSTMEIEEILAIICHSFDIQYKAININHYEIYNISKP